MKRPGLKKASKRQTLHQKHKITKKVAEHNRKQRKALKKGEALNKGSRFTKRTRDPGIPVNCPFRDEILKEAEAAKIAKEEEKEAMKERNKKWQALQQKRKNLGFSSVEEMLENAQKEKEKCPTLYKKNSNPSKKIIFSIIFYSNNRNEKLLMKTMEKTSSLQQKASGKVKTFGDR